MNEPMPQRLEKSHDEEQKESGDVTPEGGEGEGRRHPGGEHPKDGGKKRGIHPGTGSSGESTKDKFLTHEQPKLLVEEVSPFGSFST
jgi:hypothetical protein